MESQPKAVSKNASPNVPRKAVQNSTVFGQASDQVQKFTFSEKRNPAGNSTSNPMDETEKTVTIDDEQVNVRQSKDNTLDNMMGNLGKR